MKTKIILIFVSLFLLFFNGLVSAAKPPKTGGPPPPLPNIESVLVEMSDDTIIITILGNDLIREGFLPLVTLLGHGDGEMEVEKTAPAPTTEMIVAYLDVPVEAADYRLMIQTSHEPPLSDTYDLTIGAVGPQGPPGEQGEPGEAGLPGLNGKTIHNGTDTPPPDSLGAQGDFYINTATYRIYGPKTASGWGTGTGLIGPQGLDGLDGLPGIDGIPCEVDKVCFHTGVIHIVKMVCESSTASWPVGMCGEFIVDGDCESCDDGNTVSGDGCSADCTLEVFCGDGICTQPDENVNNCAVDCIAPCLVDSDCADGDTCTADRCDTNTQNCSNVWLQGCCNKDADCLDNNVCSTDECYLPDQTCTHSLISDCCVEDAQCADGSQCTTDSCDVAGNTCVFAPISNCCLVDADCLDNNVCTIDTCDVPTGACGYSRVADCCVQDGDCDDDNPLTRDRCNDATHTCFFTTDPG